MGTKPFHAILFSATVLAAFGCGSSSAHEEPDASDYPTVPTHVFRACGAIYFDNDVPDVKANTAAEGWTIGVMDHPEIATSVTDSSGCAEIALPEDSDLLVTFTRPGWVPEALTVHMGKSDMGALKARLLDGFAALRPWWWGATLSQSCVAPLPGEETGIVGALVSEADAPGDGGTPGFRPQSLILNLPGGSPRTDWLWVGPGCATYCQATQGCEAPPTGAGVIAKVPEGTVEVEMPGANCASDPDLGTLSWPVPGRPSAFKIDVRAGYFTALVTACSSE